MKNYPTGVAVTVEFPFTELSDTALTPVGLFYELKDQEGGVILPSTAIAVTPGMSKVEITIPPEHNTNIAALIEARVVVLSVITDTGGFQAERIYLLSKPAQLVVMQNSFQTYAQALAEAAQMPNMIGFETTTAPEHSAALGEAFARLTRLGYQIRRPEDVDFRNTITDFNANAVIEPRAWPLMTRERWFSNLYTDEFRRALRKAQIAEANEILRGDRVNEKRRSGVLSETIGESSMMFRVGKPLNLGISAAALEYVTGFLVYRMTLTRS